jgi:ABC-2 type transport system ATP-binding protein
VLADVIRELDAREILIHDIGLRRPTLDDVFLSLTGHVTEGEDEGGEESPDDEGEASRNVGKNASRKKARV